MFSESPTIVFLSFTFGIIGIGYFSWGKKRNIYFMLSGIALMIYPLFVSNLWPLLLWGLGFILLPFILEWLYPFN